MSSMTQEEINVSLFDRVKELEAECERLRAEAKETSLILDKANSGLDDVERTILTLTKERDEARAWVRKMVRDTQTLTCVYCGHAYPPGTPTHGSDVLTAHIEVCEKHPARKIRDERDTLRAQLAAKDAEIERLRELAQVAAAGLSQEVVMLRARISEFEPEIERLKTWRPIDTAPKDGTQILACALYLGRSDLGASPRTVQWTSFHPNAPGKAAWRNMFGHKEEWLTHWMPCPEPPSEESQS